MKKAFTLILSVFIAITFAGCKETPKDDIFTLYTKKIKGNIYFYCNQY